MKTTPAVRRARPGDVPALALLITTKFLDLPCRRSWLRRLSRAAWLYLGAWGELIASGAWTDPHLDAVLCDSSTYRPLRAALTLTPVVLSLAAGFVALFSALPLWAGAAMMVATVPGYITLFRLLRRNKAVQLQHRPGAAVITNFASRRPGAGRPLLAQPLRHRRRRRALAVSRRRGRTRGLLRRLRLRRAPRFVSEAPCLYGAEARDTHMTSDMSGI
jgi:hypothetical protein